MKKCLLMLCLLFFSLSVFADDAVLELEKAPIHRNDMGSVERGAGLFSSICMSCHTLIYLRYDAFAQKHGVRYDRMPVNVKWPTGAVPPDLSLEASVRGVDWIYTYLHSFYMDSARSTGFNNLLVPNTMMPDILVTYRGMQVLSQDADLSESYEHTLEWYDELTLKSPGSVSEQQFDAMITDIVNFLAYAAEPYHEQQVHLGVWVLGFLLILFVLVYLLKSEYWKDLK